MEGTLGPVPGYPGFQIPQYPGTRYFGNLQIQSINNNTVQIPQYFGNLQISENVPRVPGYLRTCRGSAGALSESAPNAQNLTETEPL
eukprot:1901492-Rhodomonas_salina.1